VSSLHNFLYPNPSSHSSKYSPWTILIYALSKTDSMKAVWLRHLAANLMVWRHEFNPRLAKVGFVADIVQLGQNFL